MSGREAAEQFKAKAAPILREKLEKTTLTGNDKRNYRRRLESRITKGAKRVRDTAEGTSTNTQTSAKNNQSPRVAYQEPGRTGRTWRDRSSQAGAERLSSEMSARRNAGKLPTIRSTKSQTHIKASTATATRSTAVDPAKEASKRGGNLSGAARSRQQATRRENNVTPRPTGVRTSPRSNQPGFVARQEAADRAKAAAARKTSAGTGRPSRNGQLLKDQGKPVSSVGKPSQRKSNTKAADTAKQNKSDAALRRRNEASARSTRAKDYVSKYVRDLRANKARNR